MKRDETKNRKERGRKRKNIKERKRFLLEQTGLCLGLDSACLARTQRCSVARTSIWRCLPG